MLSLARGDGSVAVTISIQAAIDRLTPDRALGHQRLERCRYRAWHPELAAALAEAAVVTLGHALAQFLGRRGRLRQRPKHRDRRALELLVLEPAGLPQCRLLLRLEHAPGAQRERDIAGRNQHGAAAYRRELDQLLGLDRGVDLRASHAVRAGAQREVRPRATGGAQP